MIVNVVANFGSRLDIPQNPDIGMQICPNMPICEYIDDYHHSHVVWGFLQAH